MSRIIRVASFALLLSFVSLPAHAVFGTPYITPEHPTPDETVYFNIYQGGCDGITGPGNPVVTQEGNLIHVLAQGVRYTDPELCTLTYGIGTQAIGAYPAGTYTMQLDLRYPKAGGEFVIETLGIVNFTVAGGVLPIAPFAAPALGLIGLVFLGLLLLVAGIVYRRHCASAAIC